MVEYDSEALDRMELIVRAGRIMEAWSAAGLIDGKDTSRQGTEDPEWRKAMVAAALIDGGEA